MADMMKMRSMYGGADMFPVSRTLVLNANNQLVKFVLNHKDGENTGKICQQLYDLAKLAHGSLSPERMTKFIARSGEIMMDMAGKSSKGRLWNIKDGTILSHLPCWDFPQRPDGMPVRRGPAVRPG